MSEYTPTTEEVHEAIAEWSWSRRMFRPEFEASDGREADRWMAAHDDEVRAGCVAEELEWEYAFAASVGAGGIVYFDVAGEADQRDPRVRPPLARRRKAGPWVPVEQEGEPE